MLSIATLAWQGMGKTAGVLLTICLKALALGHTPRCIIVAPASVLDQWEDALHAWLRLPPGSWIVTNVGKKLTNEQLDETPIVVTTPGIVYRAWKLAFHKKDHHHQVETNAGMRWVSDYARREGTALHPLFGHTDPTTGVDTRRRWNLAAVDEVHQFRNHECDQTHAMSALTAPADLRVGLTGTMIFNRPSDMIGQSIALNVPGGYTEKGKWVLDRAGFQVNAASVQEFHDLYVHRARAEELNLPDTVHTAINYDAQLPPDSVDKYLCALDSAHNLRMQIERSGQVRADELRKLMALLGGLQQFLVSPRLVEYSAPQFEANPALYDEAAAEPTGALWALRDEIDRLRSEGHSKVVVSSNHVQMMEIAARWLRRVEPCFGDIVVYKGSLSRMKRLATKQRFLAPGADSVLFLSIGAGGTGLHLVPGPEAMIFWGSTPYAPAQVEQTTCRINRMGQTAPITGAVHIRHLVPYGGVDYAIRCTHRDKRRLMDMCQENEWGHSGGGNTNGQWKRAGRIVDKCLRLNPDGNFPPLPACGINSVFGNEDGAQHDPSTVVPHMQTRGMGEPTEVREAKRRRVQSADVLGSDRVAKPAVEVARAASQSVLFDL